MNTCATSILYCPALVDLISGRVRCLVGLVWNSKLNATGSLALTPGKNDGWKTAKGRLYGDWRIVFEYGTANHARDRGSGLTCTLAKNCSFIRCPVYTYTREAL